MLRHKLIVVLGSLVGLLALAAISVILLLNNVLEDLGRIEALASETSARTTAIGSALTVIQTELLQLRWKEELHLDELIDGAEALQEQIEGRGRAPTDGSATAVSEQRLRDQRPVLTGHIASLARAADLEEAARHGELALRTTVSMWEALADVNRFWQARTERARSELLGKFRWIVLGSGLVFLLVINVSIMMLLRAATMILRPVNELVEASRHLAREDFDYRVPIDRHDEFGELARASNSLAAQLRHNEQRKLETLQQVARTLSHELNNAISIIDLQLEMVARKSGGDSHQAQRLQQIHEVLRRMSGTVRALLRVRRIVLTDYTEGVKMLDLERSVEPEREPQQEIVPMPAATPARRESDRDAEPAR